MSHGGLSKQQRGFVNRTEIQLVVNVFEVQEFQKRQKGVGIAVRYGILLYKFSTTIETSYQWSVDLNLFAGSHARHLATCFTRFTDHGKAAALAFKRYLGI